MEVKLPTRRLNPQLAVALRALRTGDRIRITQTVRVGARSWPAIAEGAYRGMNYLATGITVDRVPEDDVIVPTLHFLKDNGELASITLDEQTRVERI